MRQRHAVELQAQPSQQSPKWFSQRPLRSMHSQALLHMGCRDVDLIDEQRAAARAVASACPGSDLCDARHLPQTFHLQAGQLLQQRHLVLQLGGLGCLERQLLRSCLSLLCPGFKILRRALSACQLLLCLQHLGCQYWGLTRLICVFCHPMLKYHKQRQCLIPKQLDYHEKPWAQRLTSTPVQFMLSPRDWRPACNAATKRRSSAGL